jgi:hypothetical protein
MPLQDAGQGRLHLAQVLVLVEDEVALRRWPGAVERRQQVFEGAVFGVGECRVTEACRDGPGEQVNVFISEV